MRCEVLVRFRTEPAQTSGEVAVVRVTCDTRLMASEQGAGDKPGPANPVSPFLELMRSGDRFLQSELQRSAAIRHATTKGSVRERALLPLARQLFPRRFEVTSGEIMNATGERSRAQDLIVYDPNVVAGWQIDESDAIVPSEAVVATIEVKSGAARKDVSQASTNLASVKSVFGDRPRFGLAGDLLVDETTARPLGIAILCDADRVWTGFTDDVLDAIRTEDPELRPDIFVIPGVGAMTWPPNEHGKPIWGRIAAGEMLVLRGTDTMVALAYLISSHVLTWIPPALNVWDYLKGQPSGFDLKLTRHDMS